MKEKTVWSGEHLGVSWEINRFPGFKFELMEQNEWCWTFYLYLWIDRITENAESYWLPPKHETLSKRIGYDYYAHPILPEIEWHGGMTWYSKMSGHDGAPRVIQVGCDFQHSWDHERGDYELASVLHETKVAVESFRRLVPGYRYWCRWDGKLHAPEDVEVKADGSYACKCGKAKEAAQ